jgi:hypothetical protein
MEISQIILIIALAVQIYNVGTIWFCQIVVYPLFGKVGVVDYVEYHHHYASRIPLPIIVPGFASFILPFLVLFYLPPGVPVWMAWANAFCGLVGFLVTVGLEIPRHNKLEREGKNHKIIRQLIRFNWPRTLSITASAALTLAMALHTFVPVLVKN